MSLSSSIDFFYYFVLFLTKRIDESSFVLTGLVVIILRFIVVVVVNRVRAISAFLSDGPCRSGFDMSRMPDDHARSIRDHVWTSSALP
jgi:hypothetical protein